MTVNLLMLREYADYPEQYRTALNLLVPLWRGIPADYKRQYARSIWQQFEDNLRAAAYTDSLSKFVNSICSRMQIRISGDDVSAVNAVLMLNRNGERGLLRQLRGEATTLALMVRLENDKRKDEWARLHAAAESPDEATETTTGGYAGGLFDDEVNA